MSFSARTAVVEAEEVDCSDRDQRLRRQRPLPQHLQHRRSVAVPFRRRHHRWQAARATKSSSCEEVEVRRWEYHAPRGCG